MYHEFLKQGLKDDGMPWDWTTLGTLGSADPETSKAQAQGASRAKIVCKAQGIWAGQGLALGLSRAAQDLGYTLEVKERVNQGATLAPGVVVMEWNGDPHAILALERPALNLASYVSGIATQARRLVDAAKKAAESKKIAVPRVTPTRKTLPGYRDLAIAGVLAGGGHSHRVSLSGGVLIKENHIAAAGSIARAIQGARGVAPHGLQIEVEVRDIGELSQALAQKAHGVLLDNFEPAQVAEALRLIANSPNPETWVEVSGGVTHLNIGDFVQKGVHVISSGQLTLSVTALDLSLLIEA